MSMINTFLQKRKMQESHYGIYMVIMAYVLSFLLLILGSDAIYHINSRAEGISMDTDEATVEMLGNEFPGIQSFDLKKQLLHEQLINPYGLSDNEAVDTYVRVDNEILQNISGDTYWLLGYAMNHEEYTDLMNQMNRIVPLSDKSAEKEQELTTSAMTLTEGKDSLLISATREEVEMLERIVEAEATGEDLEGKILIANVVINRILDDNFPDTVKGVVFHKVKGDYQFSPIADKRYFSVKVTSTSKEAVSRALKGEDYSEGALYFMARNKTKKSNARWFDQNLQWLFKHGGHEFYKNK